MKPKILNPVIILLLLAFCTNCSVDNQISDDSDLTDISLENGFLNPPKEAAPYIYYLMINGYANTDYFTQELNSLSEKGIGGLTVFDMGGRQIEENLPESGPPFMSDEWLDNFAVG